MIPSCIKLDPRSAAKLARWVEHLRKPQFAERNEAQFEEDCVVTSPITFHIYETGIGTIITATAFDEEVNLSIEDDNELWPDEWL